MEYGLFHFDPIEILVLIGGFIATWTVLRRDSQWHTKWIRKHSEDCDEQRKFNNQIISGLRETTGKLTVLTEAHGDRLSRIENRMDHQR